jgi:hypothetical protein
MNLDKKHFQDFMKRLRKRSLIKLKYYACGEYGGASLRPHYHAIMFNSNPEDIMASWTFGQHYFGDVSGASIGYVLKYMSKKGRIPLHANDDRLPEFSLMSKGLGANYMTDQMVKWHKNDLIERMHLVLKDGRKIAMPRYYKDKIYTDTERERIAHFAAIEARRAEESMQAEGLKKYGNNWEAIKLANHLHSFFKMENDANRRNKI